VPVVWTAHNLTPHEKRPDVYDSIYRLWAERAEAVIHHSHAGRDRFLERYPSPPGTRHVVIPHGHFGELWADHAPTDRAAAERALGLAPCRLRIGVVGAPRREKLVAELLRGVAASARTDVQVACWSLDRSDQVPDDPRIVVAETYEMTDAATYATRLAACDVLAMPFDPDGEMLATGTVFDAIGRGLPVLRSDWSFLVESLGDAGIPMGHTAASIAASIDGLDDDVIERARHAALVRRDELAWDLISARTLSLFEDVLR
jgi:glycosyltransferase involved in cell wall biosynthesis